METIENKVARAILQKQGSIEVDGVTYTIEQPTTATLIEISALASELPNFDLNVTLGSVILSAKECVQLGKIAAMLILGAKRVREKYIIAVEETQDCKVWSWKKMRNVHKVTKVTKNVLEYEHLASCLLDMPIAELQVIINARLADMNIADFFQITTSLKGLNVAKSTKEVETASGE